MTQTNQIELARKALLKLFARRRIVFWYDEDAQMQQLYNTIDLDGVTKIEIANNEFAIKKRMVVDEPEQMFLVYAPYAKPKDKDNWLLDLMLGGELFAADPSSMYLQEVGYTIEDKTFVDKHIAFFESSERKAKLAKLNTESTSNKTLKAISIIAGTQVDYDKVWFALFAEELDGKNGKKSLLERANFMQSLWDKAKIEWGYNSSDASIRDLLVWFIDSCHKQSVGAEVEELSPEAKLFLGRWRENIHGREIFDRWSEIVESDTNAATRLSSCDTTKLLTSDIYKSVDREIIRAILTHITGATLPPATLISWIEERRTKYYYSTYEVIYKALECALKLQMRVSSISFNTSVDADIFKAYSDDGGWYEVDKLYRGYIYHSQNCGDILNSLTAYVDKLYSNKFISELSSLWQQKVDSMTSWDGGSQFIIKQKNFYANWIKKPYIEKGKRIFVIISDALRYESAAELRERIIAGNKYDAKLTPTLGVLPSYTQLGMAAMLPHSKLSYDNASDTVFVDGVSSQGTANRRKILQSAFAASMAYSAEDFLAMNAKSAREEIKEYKVIYIYSNTIDKVGDDKMSEGKVFDATQDEFANIDAIVKHIVNMNGNNIIITSDHGYIYQNAKLDNSDFSEFSPEGKIYKVNRRFVIGKNLSVDSCVNTWKSSQLGIDGDTEFITPKSVNRIRVQGAGSRFVHGGSSLQEIVIPVLEVNKKRHDTLQPVSVDLIGLPIGIKGNIQPISFYQQKAVRDKVVARTIKAAFFTKDGMQLSDTATLIFDCKDDDSMKREQRYNFTFTPAAANYNNQMVVLKLESAVAGTTQFTEYDSREIKMMIAFSSEFDF